MRRWRHSDPPETTLELMIAVDFLGDLDSFAPTNSPGACTSLWALGLLRPTFCARCRRRREDELDTRFRMPHPH